MGGVVGVENERLVAAQVAAKAEAWAGADGISVGDCAGGEERPDRGRFGVGGDEGEAGWGGGWDGSEAVGGSGAAAVGAAGDEAVHVETSWMKANGVGGARERWAAMFIGQ